MNQKKNEIYNFKNFMPLIIVFSCILTLTFLHQFYYGWCFYSAMRIFMATFFLVFGLFKIMNLSHFVQAYAMYDLLASRIVFYGYMYPFIECALGMAYLMKWHLYFVNWCSLILMVFSAVGVFNALHKNEIITCACLGAIFKIPMTYVTLLEDLIMAAMAVIMIYKG